MLEVLRVGSRMKYDFFDCSRRPPEIGDSAVTFRCIPLCISRANVFAICFCIWLDTRRRTFWRSYKFVKRWYFRTFCKLGMLKSFTQLIMDNLNECLATANTNNKRNLNATLVDRFWHVLYSYVNGKSVFRRFYLHSISATVCVFCSNSLSYMRKLLL